MGVLAVAAILIAAVIWSVGSYRSAKTIFKQKTDSRLHQAVDVDFSLRRDALGRGYVSGFEPYKDTSEYITKTIKSEDTTIYVRYKKKDNAIMMRKIWQYIFIKNDPINPRQIDSLFQENMADILLPVHESSYVEYLDLKNDSVIGSSAPDGKLPRYNVISDIDTLDILNTIGVRAYVKVPVVIMLRPVMLPFIVSMILIIAAVIFIILLLRDVFRLHRDGFRLLKYIAWRAEIGFRRTSNNMSLQQVKEMYDNPSILEELRSKLYDSGNYFEKLKIIIENEERKHKFNKVTFHLASFLEDFKARYESTRRKTVIFTVNVSSRIFMYTDKLYFGRILDELCENSVKFSDDPVEIHITAVQNGRELVIVVADNGWGIPEEDIDNIFQPLYKIKDYEAALQRNKKSSGLGLTFVYSFVRSLDGEITALSEDGMTGFRMSFYYTKSEMKRIESTRSLLSSL